MTRREAYLVTTMLGIIVVAVSILLDNHDPQKPYLRDEQYCKMDGDCAIVYNGVSLKCMTVNNLQKDKYEKDDTCVHRFAYCVNKKCVLP